MPASGDRTIFNSYSPGSNFRSSHWLSGARWKDGQYGRTRERKETQFFFEDLLHRLDTDYIDIGMFHCVDTDREFDQIFSGGTA